MVKTESGAKLPATYRSGRFDEWKSKNRVSIPRVGETENAGPQRRTGSAGGRKWNHNQVVTAKPLDKRNTDYERKSRQLKKRQSERGEEPVPARGTSTSSRGRGKKPMSRFGGKPVGRVKNELKTVDQIRKTRQVAENRKAKNARQAPRGKRGRR